MIEIPKCFRCIHYEDGKCKAYPEGIPLVEVGRKPEEESCSNEVKFKKK